jgi:hypothetical protein
MENQEENVETTQLTEEQQAAIAEAKRKIDEARLPLNEGATSTDVIQRIKCLTDILNMTIFVPKTTQEKVLGQNIEKITGSIQLSIFPSYGQYNPSFEQWCNNNFVNIMMRISELAVKL